MTTQPIRTAGRPPRSTIHVALAVVIAAIIGAIGCQALVTSPSSAIRDAGVRTVPEVESGHQLPPLGARRGSTLGLAGGAVPDGVTVFDDEFPAVANLDPALLEAVRQAARDAAEDRVVFSVNSGWRSPDHQNQLLREAVAEYGSEGAAARWVATADTSPHVSGDAIDIGHSEATTWLAEHGAAYGLCQIYRNEPWHYELRPDAVDHQCPAMYADPTQDPRMQ